MDGDRTVIVAYDGSPAAQQAVREAAALFSSCRLLIASVWEPALATSMYGPGTTGMMPPMDPQVANEVQTGLEQRAENLAAEGAELASSLGCPAEPRALPDEMDVSQTLLKLADDLGAAAIVVGSRGHTGIRARLEGSTSKTVVKDGRCPVLVVHEAPQQKD